MGRGRRLWAAPSGLWTAAWPECLHAKSCSSLKGQMGLRALSLLWVLLSLKGLGYLSVPPVASTAWGHSCHYQAEAVSQKSVL